MHLDMGNGYNLGCVKHGYDGEKAGGFEMGGGVGLIFISVGARIGVRRRNVSRGARTR